MILTLVSHHLCPYVQRAAIALHEKDVEFERINIDLADKPAWFKALSPLGKVPLLKLSRPGHEDVVLFESVPIVEYIEDTLPAPRLHPADPIERAQHRAWIEFGSAVLGDIWQLETATDARTFENARTAILGKFDRLEATLGKGPWFGGEAFSLVDAVFGPVFRYFDVFDRLIDIQAFTNRQKLSSWRRRLAARPSIKEAVSTDYHQRLIQFLKDKNAWLVRQGGGSGSN